WGVVRTPNVRSENFGLWAIDGVSARSLWAAGTADRADGSMRSFMEHWDGRKWSFVPTPHRGTDELLMRIRAFGPRNAWAVGYYANEAGIDLRPEGFRSLIQHWDGKRWRVVPHPNASLIDTGPPVPQGSPIATCSRPGPAGA